MPSRRFQYAPAFAYAHLTSFGGYDFPPCARPRLLAFCALLCRLSFSYVESFSLRSSASLADYPFLPRAPPLMVGLLPPAAESGVVPHVRRYAPRFDWLILLDLSL